MDRKKFFLTFVVLVFGVAGGALGADILWNNADPENSSWCDADNWDPENVPAGSSATAIINWASPDRGPIIGIGCNVDVGAITGPEPNYTHTQVMDINTSGTVRIRGDWMWTMEEASEEHGGGGTGVININGSPTITIDGENWRGGDYGMGIINIAGNPHITVKGSLRGADSGSGSLYFTMSGGYLDIDSEFVIGDVGGGAFNMHGGTILVGEALDLGGLRGTAPIDVNMTGGYVSVPDEFRFPGSGSRVGAVFYLKGGVLDCNDFVHGQDEADNPYTDEWRLDIEQGTLKIWFDKRAAIDANVANGQITGYDGEGKVVVEFIDGNTVVTALPPDPNTATNPIPPNRSEDQDPNVDLGWTSGINAAQHKIFFGTSFEDVNTMTDPCETKSRGDETYEPNTLELETTYYWRIDEVNGPKTWRGRVWHFTTKSPVIDPNMLMYLKLDETSGYFVKDSSGYGNHGIIDGNELGWDPNDAHPHDGGSRNFSDVEGDDDAATVIDCKKSTVLNTIDNAITVSVWLKDAYNSGGDDNWVFHCGIGGEQGPYQVGACVVTEDIEPEGQALWRAGDDPCDLLTWDLDGRKAKTLQDWHLWAFVKDESAGVMRIYFDGIMRKEKSGTLNTLGFIKDTAFKIGATNWENFTYMGKMDDFRVYDYALSDKQIEELYRGGDVGYPWAPSPGNYAEDVPRDANVSWRPGNYAVQHKVFFGADWDDVNDMTEPCATPGVGNELYDPGILDLKETYYWRVDEVNDPCVWRGPIWRFTVADFLILDDFEQYHKTDNPIYYTWYCKQAMPYGRRSGAILSLSYDPVHTGEQAMKYEYETDETLYWDQDYAYADACLPLDEIDGFQDWTTVDVRLLTIFFYGQAENDANQTEQMYLGVHDSAMRYAEMRYGDHPGEALSDLKAEEWQRWDVPFIWFTDSNAAVPNDIDFSAISSVYLGFGNRRNPVPAGNGVVYFDDLRLNMAICRPELLKPAYDFSGNCIVDIADVRIMGQQWLEHDVNFVDDLGIQVQEPCDANLLGHWELDEGTGTFAEDSSVYGNDGTLETTDEGGYSWVAGRIGNAVDFSGGRVRVPDTNDLKPDTNQVSVTAWIYIREEMSSGRVVVKGKNDHESYEMEVDSDDEFVFQFRDSNHTDHERYEANDVVWPNDWIHLAGTYDGSTIACYVNGQLGEAKDINNPYGLARCPIEDPGLAIGNEPDANDSAFEGIIDDVRVYNYGLSHAEVAWLATGGSGEFLLTAPGNIYSGEDPEVINFKDFAQIFESWLDEQLWPPEPVP